MKSHPAACKRSSSSHRTPCMKTTVNVCEKKAIVLLYGEVNEEDMKRTNCLRCLKVFEIVGAWTIM